MISSGKAVCLVPFEKALLALHYTFQFGQSGPDLGPDVADLDAQRRGPYTRASSATKYLKIRTQPRFAKALAGRNAPDATRLGFSLTYSL